MAEAELNLHSHTMQSQEDQHTKDLRADLPIGTHTGDGASEKVGFADIEQKRIIPSAGARRVSTRPEYWSYACYCVLLYVTFAQRMPADWGYRHCALPAGHHGLWRLPNATPRQYRPSQWNDPLGREGHYHQFVHPRPPRRSLRGPACRLDLGGAICRLWSLGSMALDWYVYRL